MNTDIKITGIESTEESLKIDFRYKNNFGPGAWVRIHPETHVRIKNSDHKLVLREAIGIPVTPDKFEFDDEQEFLYFTLQFPPLPQGIDEFDLIEDLNDKNAFNFYDLNLSIGKNLMSCSKSDVLKKIEFIALEIKSKGNTPRNFDVEIERLSDKITELADFLSLSKKETLVFVHAFYSVVVNDAFCLSEMKKSTNFNPFDFLEIKQIIRDLEFKGWLKSSGRVGVFHGRSRNEEKSYTITSGIIKSLYNNTAPKITKRVVDVFSIVDMINRCLRSHADWDIETDEMIATITEYEELYSELQPFKLCEELNLNLNERLIFYYVITKTYSNDPITDIDRLISNTFKGTIEKIEVKALFAKKESELFKQNLVEFLNEEFKTDKKIKLTEEGKVKVFGPDAIFLHKEEQISNSLCRLIKYESITEKELFYNDKEEEAIAVIKDFLNKEKYNGIVNRLKENKMRSGLTILLHGYPGTGKTESVYQIAKKTERDILMVNISEIRDKYVGESEKRLKTIFDTYRSFLKQHEHAPILLFNESDALIGKRMNIEHSVDQMNNAMQNILLQELEDFNGILIATTNLTQNLDDAFDRRFLYKIKFAKPSDDAKKLIWKNKLNFLSDDEALKLANEFQFSGGQIENISRKIFLDSILIGKDVNIDTVIQHCLDELQLKKNVAGRIGFNL